MALLGSQAQPGLYLLNSDHKAQQLWQYENSAAWVNGDPNAGFILREPQAAGGLSTFTWVRNDGTGLQFFAQPYYSVQGVAGDVNAIGYFGFAYYAENTGKLKALPIVEKEGKPAVSPSAETVIAGTYQPLARPIFIYINAKSMAKPEVKKFVDFYMTQGAKMAKEVKYVPLPANIYTSNLKHIADNKKGTIFGGKNEVGISIEELVKREAKL